MLSAIRALLRQKSRILPNRLYRYRRVSEWLEPIICKQILYCASPRDCNDPHDCRVNIDYRASERQLRVFWDQMLVAASNPMWRAVARGNPMDPDLSRADAMTAQAAKDPERLYREWRARFYDPEVQLALQRNLESRTYDLNRICCFSASPDNQLMWSHYADSGRGILLEFAPDNAASPGAPYIVESVRYVSQLPAVRFFNPRENAAMAQTILTTKAHCWSYEQEYRLLWGRTDSHEFSFPKRWLTGIVFGYASRAEDRTYIARLAKDANLDLAFSEAVLSPTSYEITIQPCERMA
jgi:Protein of unknown function (DUF2971)